MKSSKLWMLAAVILAGSVSVFAQTNVNEEQGMKPYDSWHGGDLDSVSMTNGVATFRRAPGEQVMSVTDQYLYRGGISHAVPRLRGVAVSLGGRMEGVPVRDAFGRSDGFRRPGYAISVDPGFLAVRRNYTFSCNIPWAVERNRRRSVADIQNHTHGDAAFADYALMFSLSRRF